MQRRSGKDFRVVMDTRAARALIVSVNAQVKQRAGLDVLPFQLGDASGVVVDGGGIVSGRDEGVAAGDSRGILIGNPKTQRTGIGHPKDPGKKSQAGESRTPGSKGRSSEHSPLANFKSMFFYVFHSH